MHVYVITDLSTRVHANCVELFRLKWAVFIIIYIYLSKYLFTGGLCFNSCRAVMWFSEISTTVYCQSMFRTC